MRASHIALIAAVLATPSIAFSQTDGPVGGKVGSDLGTSPTQSAPSVGARPYGAAPESGPRAGYSGSIMSGQIVPQNVPVTPQPGGQGSATIDGHRVLVDPNSNRILRVFN
jgi:hypothetical protein